MDAEEEVMLDVNILAEGHEYFAVAGRQVSANNDILAFAEDNQGRRIYTLRFKNLETGEFYPDEIQTVTSNMAWANDNKTLFYTRQDPTTLRWDKVYRHELGTPVENDVLVYEETEDTFYAFVYRTKSKRYMIVGSSQTLSAEYRYVDADNPTGDLTLIQARERGLEYDVDHYGDHFYIRTNLDAKNFRLVRTPVTQTTKDNWEEVLPNRDDVLLEGFEIFKDFLVVSERKNGLMELRIRPWDGSAEHYIDFGEPAYLAYVSAIHLLIRRRYATAIRR